MASGFPLSFLLPHFLYNIQRGLQQKRKLFATAEVRSALRARAPAGATHLRSPTHWPCGLGWYDPREIMRLHKTSRAGPAYAGTPVDTGAALARRAQAGLLENAGERAPGPPTPAAVSSPRGHAALHKRSHSTPHDARTSHCSLRPVFTDIRPLPSSGFPSYRACSPIVPNSHSYRQAPKVAGSVTNRQYSRASNCHYYSSGSPWLNLCARTLSPSCVLCNNIAHIRMPGGSATT